MSKKFICFVMLIVVTISTLFVGCGSSSSSSRTELEALVYKWSNVQKSPDYNPHGWEGLQAAIGMAQRVLDYPVSDEQIEVAVELFEEAVGWLNCSWYMGFSDDIISVHMTVEASGGGRIFDVNDFPEIELSHVNNGMLNLSRRRWVTLFLSKPCNITVLYSVTLLMIRQDIYLVELDTMGLAN